MTGTDSVAVKHGWLYYFSITVEYIYCGQQSL